MTVVWVVVVVLVAVALVLMAAGLLEVYVQLEQVRTVLRLQDQPTPVHLASLGGTLDELLPDPPDVVGRATAGARTAYVLVLSSSCAVCQLIGSGLGTAADRFGGTLAVLVAAENEQAGRAFVSRAELPPGLAAVDPVGRAAKQLGIEASPTVVSLVDGRLRSAATLSSFRQLELFWEQQQGELAGSGQGG